jgi:hypothetical protein
MILSWLRIKADIPGPLRYLLITLKPLRGPSVGVQPPTDAEKSDKVILYTLGSTCKFAIFIVQIKCITGIYIP